MSNSTLSAPRVAVVGAGIIGLSVAWRLLQAGADVTLFEKGEPGRGTSWAAAGMLAPAFEAVDPEIKHPDMIRAMVKSRSLWDRFAAELLERSGVSIGYQTGPTLALALTEDLTHYIDDLRSVLAQHGLPFNEISPRDVSIIEPAINGEVLSALQLHTDGVVDNRAVVRALEQVVSLHGVKWERCAAEIVIDESHNRVCGVKTQKGEARYDRVVLCVGAAHISHVWQMQGDALARVVVPQAVSNRWVQPAHGELTSLVRDANAPRSTIRFGGGYITPHKDRVVVHRLHSNNEWSKVASMLPWLSSAVERDRWSGYRPKTEDGAPIIGESEYENLIWATGHFRNGILLTPLTADWVTSIVFENVPGDAMGFSPARLTSDDTKAKGPS